jgi:mTERF
MLKKAPYMLHVDAPHIAGEKRSPVSRVEDYNTAASSDRVACNALKVLQLLSSLDLPDLDKVVRTQPLLLLADIEEVNARVDFLFHLCRDSKPAQVSRANPLENPSVNERVDISRSSSSSKSDGFSSNLYNLSSLTKDRIERPTTPASLTSSLSADQSTECRSRNKGTESESDAASIAVTCGGRSQLELVVDVDIDVQRSQLQGGLPCSTGELATAPPPPPAATSSDIESSPSQSQQEALEAGLTQLKGDPSTVPAVSSSSSKSSEAAADSRHHDTTVLSKDAFQSNQDAAQKMFGSLLLSYPGVLSIESRYEPPLEIILLYNTTSPHTSPHHTALHYTPTKPYHILKPSIIVIQWINLACNRQMKAAGNALRTAGLRRNEVLLIARRHPPVLGRDPALLMNLISFLRFTCGLNKVPRHPYRTVLSCYTTHCTIYLSAICSFDLSFLPLYNHTNRHNTLHCLQADLQPFLFKYPALLGADLAAIEPKANYLFVSLGGSQEMLRRFPSFLSFDLEEHIRPRAEFLRAMKIDPLQNGLAFLVSAPAKEIANIAGVRVEFFNQFQAAYSDLIKKKLNEKLEAYEAVISLPATQADNRPFQFSSSILEDSSSERTFLDELDFGF